MGGKISEVDDVWKAFRSVEKAKKVVSLRAWQPFQDIANALSAATGIIDGELSKPLKKFLKKNIVKAGLEDTLAVADATHNTADDSTLKSAKKRKLESESDSDDEDDEPVKKKKKTKSKDKSKKL